MSNKLHHETDENRIIIKDRTIKIIYNKKLEEIKQYKTYSTNVHENMK